MSRTRVAVAFISVALSNGAWWACPLCDSETAAQVRAGIVDENLPLSVLAIVLPFAAMVVVVALVHLGGPRRGRKDSHGH